MQISFKSKTVSVSQNRRSRNALPKVIVAFLGACATTSPAATGLTNAQTLTPAQQAAIQRADQQGRAIQAAIQASKGGK